jgi:hypothetical protein
MLLEAGDACLGVVKDRGSERRVRSASCKNVHEVVQAAGTTRCNHRNRNGGRYSGGELAVKPDLRAVAIDRRQQNFPGATRLGLLGPFNGIALCEALATANVDSEAVALFLCVDRNEHCLTAVSIRERRDELRIFQRGSIQAHLIGPRVDRRSGVIFCPDAATDRKRDEQLAGDRSNRVGECTTAFQRRRDVEDDELVNPLRL